MPAASLALLALGLLALSPAPASPCSVSAQGVAFGTYNPQAPAPLDGVGSIDLACHRNTSSAVVTLGTGASGSYAARRMSSGGRNLLYNLYTAANRVVVWGNGSGGSTTVTASGGHV